MDHFTLNLNFGLPLIFSHTGLVLLHLHWMVQVQHRSLLDQKKQSMVSSPAGCDLTTKVYNSTVVLTGVIM